MVSQYKTTISEEHANSVNSTLAECVKNAIVLNIDDYHSIHTKWMLNTTTTSTAIYLVTILMNPIITQPVISKMNIYNPVLVDAELIKTNMGNRFMKFYSFSYNRRWGIHMVDDDTRLKELTVHSYDVRLKEKRNARLIKDVIFINLQENDLHSLDIYIKAINTIVNIPSMQQYI